MRGAHWTAFIRGNQSLQLHGDQARQAMGLIARDKAAHRFSGHIAAAQEIIVLVKKIASRVGRIRFPVVGGSAVTSPPIQGQAGR